MKRTPPDLGEYHEPPAPYERMNPIDRFAHLPVKTREWLESLRKEDIEQLEGLLVLYGTLQALGKFGKWLVYTAVGAAALGVAFGKNVLEMLGMMRGPN